MTDDELRFFLSQAPDALPLYEAFAAAIRAAWPDVRVTVHATQITFANRYGFAFASLPRRKGAPGRLMVSFGLPSRAISPRIAAASEPYPGRWTHHVVLESAAQIDPELMGWIAAAYAFTAGK